MDRPAGSGLTAVPRMEAQSDSQHAFIGRSVGRYERHRPELIQLR
jgi:hypothetical protein